MDSEFLQRRAAKILQMFPSSVFKGLEAKYAQSLLDGELLFRSFSYFMRTSDVARSDGYDGRHIDAPDHDVVVENLTTGAKISGKMEFHNISGKPNRIFCFCTSKERAACEIFGDTVVEVTDVAEFARRLERAIRRLGRLIRLDTPLLLAREVLYYEPNQAAPSTLNVKDANDLAFVKRSIYKSEHEFRFVFSQRGGRELIQKIALKAYRPVEDIESVNDRMHLLKVGSIRDIARISAPPTI